jgi:hypothetical protein
VTCKEKRRKKGEYECVQPSKEDDKGKCLKVNRRKVLSGARDVERLVMNHGNDLSHGRAWCLESWADEVVIVIAPGCEVRKMSHDYDSAEGHCCYGAAMEVVAGGNQSSHQCYGRC